MDDRPFFRLEIVRTTDGAHFSHLEGYEDDFMLLEGEVIADEYPGDAQYTMDSDYPDSIALDDSVYNLDYQLVINERLQSFLSERVGDGIEFLPVALVNHKGRTEDGPFFIANILQHVDVVDKDATVHTWNPLDDTAMMSVENLTIDASRVPEGVDLFRLTHLTELIGVSRALAASMEAEGFTGIAFTDFVEYRG